jgi:hypothetical protein
MEKSAIQKEPVEIKNKMTEDLDLFYSVQDMIDLFDYKQSNYSKFCLRVSYILTDDGSELEHENQITGDPLYNYLTEEERPRDILYYICSLDDTLS